MLSNAACPCRSVHYLRNDAMNAFPTVAHPDEKFDAPQLPDRRVPGKSTTSFHVRREQYRRQRFWHSPASDRQFQRRHGPGEPDLIRPRNLGRTGNQPALQPARDHAVGDDRRDHGQQREPAGGVDGANAGSTANGLVVAANAVTIEGLGISGFGGDAIVVSGSNDVIAGNHIGTPVISSGDGNEDRA